MSCSQNDIVREAAQEAIEEYQRETMKLVREKVEQELMEEHANEK